MFYLDREIKKYLKCTYFFWSISIS